MTWETISTSSENTTKLAEAVGNRLRGGEAIELVSDLGGGKTTFVRGLVSGAGSKDKVSSPTFTLTNEYKAKKFVIYHFDFYRLGEPGIMADELLELVNDKSAVVVVEWADIVKNVLPERRLTIRITSTAEHERKLYFSYPKELGYLIPRSE